MNTYDLNFDGSIIRIQTNSIGDAVERAKRTQSRNNYGPLTGITLVPPEEPTDMVKYIRRMTEPQFFESLKNVRS
jgi:hypothetical protein